MTNLSIAIAFLIPIVMNKSQLMELRVVKPGLPIYVGIEIGLHFF